MHAGIRMRILPLPNHLVGNLGDAHGRYYSSQSGQQPYIKSPRASPIPYGHDRLYEWFVCILHLAFNDLVGIEQHRRNCLGDSRGSQKLQRRWVLDL